MGWTVLYIAFGIVALWLLGEVLLQYKARLRWRLLAFCGFLCVVLGVLLPSVVVIALGAITFAVGQTCVTLSFRRGFSTGWALGGSPGVSRRRKSGPARDARAVREPTPQVPDHSYASAGPVDSTDPMRSMEPAEPEVYEPQPLPEDTGQYGIYTDTAYTAEQDRGENYAPYGEGYAAYDAYGDHGQQQQPAARPDYGDGQHQYPTYADPYGGGQQYAAYGTYGSYGGQQQYATADPYAQPTYSDTPPGGVWVPQQREDEYIPPMPQQPPAQYGHDQGYDGQQYRY